MNWFHWLGGHILCESWSHFISDWWWFVPLENMFVKRRGMKVLIIRSFHVINRVLFPMLSKICVSILMQFDPNTDNDVDISKKLIH